MARVRADNGRLCRSCVYDRFLFHTCNTVWHRRSAVERSAAFEESTNGMAGAREQSRYVGGCAAAGVRGNANFEFCVTRLARGFFTIGGGRSATSRARVKVSNTKFAIRNSQF